MSQGTKIEWADSSWNVSVGCKKVSPGCVNCYAERMAARLKAMGQEPYQTITTKTGRWNGTIKLLYDKLQEPLRWRKPQRIFVDSMSDLFHEKVPVAFIAQVFNTMASRALACRKKDCPHDDESCWRDPGHTYIILTKRAGRMYRLMTDELPNWVSGLPAEAPLRRALEAFNWPLRNVQLGVSAENQEMFDERVEWLLKTPAASRAISIEPMLGPIDMTGSGRLLYGRIPPGAVIHQVYLGGENGPNARAMHADWARQVRDQCVSGGIAFLLSSTASGFTKAR